MAVKREEYFKVIIDGEDFKTLCNICAMAHRHLDHTSDECDSEEIAVMRRLISKIQHG